MKRALVAMGFVALGFAALATFVLTKPEATKAPPKDLSVLVETLNITTGNHQARVTAQGTVIAAQQIDLQPEVTGRVSWVSDDLVPGGSLKVGQPLLRIDSRDYQLTVEQRHAEVDRAAVELQMENGRKVVAEQEWRMLAQTDGEAQQQPSPLALREPQLKAAQVGLKAAQSGLERARLNLSRTTLRAPFNATVIEEAVDVGQQVTSQSRLAKLVGTDVAWVRVSVPMQALAHIVLPTQDHVGSEARIWYEVGANIREHRGTVARLLGEVDGAGRMAQLLIEIDHPFAHPSPLLFGSFVNVDILGDELEEVAVVPRRAIRDGNRIFVADKDNRLQSRTGNIVWRERDVVLVKTGVNEGERVIISNIANPVVGMKLRIAPSSEASPTDDSHSSPPEPSAPAVSANTAGTGDAEEVAQ